MSELIRGRRYLGADRGRTKTIDQPPAVQETISVQDAAQRSAMSPTTIKRKIASGELKSVQDQRGHHRITQDDLMAFLALQKPTSRPGATKDTDHGQTKDRPRSDQKQQKESATDRPRSDNGQATVGPWTDHGPTKDRSDDIIKLLERDLERAYQRIESLEARNEKLQSELLSLMHELKEALTGKTKAGLSAWFGKVRGTS